MKIFGVKLIDGRRPIRTRLRQFAERTGLKAPKKRKRQLRKPKPSLVPVQGKPPIARLAVHQPAQSARAVNQELIRRGHFERLQSDMKAQGRWFWIEGLTGSWTTTEVPGTHRIGDHTIDEWIQIRHTMAGAVRDPLEPSQPPILQKQPNKVLARAYLDQPAERPHRVNRELKRLGYAEQLKTDRHGRWWFAGGSTASWRTARVSETRKIGDLTVREWVALRHQLASDVVSA